MSNEKSDKVRDEYLRMLYKADQDASKDYDKTVLMLSSGAMGISTVFLKDILTTVSQDTIIFITIAWAAFTSSLIATLSSFLTSQFALRKAIKQVRCGEKPKNPGAIYSMITISLNIISGVIFIIGAVFLGVFLVFNL